MPANTGAFSRLLAPGLRKIYFDDWKQWPEEYTKFVNIEKSTRAYEEEAVMAGLGRFQRKEEGKSVIYDTGIQGGVQRYTHATWALGFRVTREMYNDDLYGIMKRMSKELALAGRQTLELEVSGLLDDAFDGDVNTAINGEALCDEHPLLVGGTYTNKPATDIDFGIGALRAASQRMEKTVSERGFNEMRGTGSLIIVSPEFSWIAKEILGSDKAAYTADNTMNAFDGMGLNYMVSHFKADTDSWFLLSAKNKHYLKFFWRQQPIFENGDDFDTKDAKFTGYMRFSYGFTDWRGVDGSSGGA
jgi:hypothetical protein